MKRSLFAVLLMLVATFAWANGGHHGGGPGGGAEGPGPAGGNIIVTAEGNAIVLGASSITAISPTGVTLWTATLPSGEGRGHLVLSGGNLIAVSVTRATDTTAASSALTAISTATGATAWTLTIDGEVHGGEPFSGGTYFVVVTPPATSDGTAARSLVAVSNSGAILFTVPLT